MDNPVANPQAAAVQEPAPVAARAYQLTKVYGEGSTQVVALDNVDITVVPGEFTAIMGPSGSGKSTLMHCLAGLDSLTAGEVYLGDTALSQLSDKDLTQLRRDQVGFIFQSFNLIPTLTAEENITLPRDIAGRAPDRAWFDAVVDTIGLRDRLGHRPSELSGGQQQRVACARAIVSQPTIIFADEPTGNLDSTSSSEVLGFIRHSVDQFGQTIVMVTHDAVAAAYADRVVFLKDGHIVSELRNPTSDTILDQMKNLDTQTHPAFDPNVAPTHLGGVDHSQGFPQAEQHHQPRDGGQGQLAQPASHGIDQGQPAAHDGGHEAHQVAPADGDDVNRGQAG